jgi:ankyrin repeat protein
LHIACEEAHLATIEFLLDNGADINKQDDQQMTPLHYAIKSHHAIHEKHFSACKLILKYEQVSIQNIKSGITLSAESPLIKALLEKKLKKRKRVKRRAQIICNFCKDVPQMRFMCGDCKIAIYCSLV